jgi:hypothetical protein
VITNEKLKVDPILTLTDGSGKSLPVPRPTKYGDEYTYEIQIPRDAAIGEATVTVFCIDLAGNRGSSEGRFTISMEEVEVWPGDTNNDGMVDEKDVFPIAMYWLREGPPGGRSDVFSAQMRSKWDPEGATYADADGNGIVDGRDVLVVARNWMKSHPPSAGIRISGTMASSSHLPAYESMYEALSSEGGIGEGFTRLRDMLAGLIAGLSSPVSQTGIGMPRPNPFTRSIGIPYTVGEGGRVRIGVFNAAGQLIRLLLDEPLPSGSYQMVWDGRDGKGNELPPGTYWIVLEAKRRYVVKVVKNAPGR